MQLGLARMDVPGDTPAARALAQAHEQAKELISEMRELIHGIHPQLLTDRGLSAALQELAADYRADPCREPRRSPPPRPAVSNRETERALLERLGLLPDRPG